MLPKATRSLPIVVFSSFKVLMNFFQGSHEVLPRLS
jgi:hypothetical protein